MASAYAATTCPSCSTASPAYSAVRPRPYPAAAWACTSPITSSRPTRVLYPSNPPPARAQSPRLRCLSCPPRPCNAHRPGMVGTMGMMGMMGTMAQLMMVRKRMIETNNHKEYPQDDDETTRGEPIQVLVVDDQYAFTDLLRVVLNLQPDINVVGTALTGDEGLRVALETHPDVALVDYHMPIMSGLDVIKGLKSARE